MDEEKIACNEKGDPLVWYWEKKLCGKKSVKEKKTLIYFYPILGHWKDRNLFSCLSLKKKKFFLCWEEEKGAFPL